MRLRVMDMMKYPAMAGAAVRAGNGGIANEISNIMVMEAPDIEAWATKGLVLLSSLYCVQHYSEAEQLDFMARMHRLGISAMIIKIDRFIGEIPQGFLIGGERYHIPIIQIGKDVLYRDVIAEVMQALFSKQVQVLEFYREAHNRFTQMALQNSSGQDIVWALADLVGMPVSIQNADGSCLYTTSQELQACKVLREEAFDGMADVKYPYKRRVVAYDTVGIDEYHTQIAIEVSALSAPTQVLVVHETNHFVKELDIMAIENAAAFIQMDMLRQLAVSESRRKYHNEIFDDLINGRYASREIMLAYASLLGMSEQGRYQMVVWQFKEEGAAGQHLEELGRTLLERIGRVIGGLVYHRVIRSRIQCVFSVGQDEEEFHRRLQEYLHYLAEEFREEELLLRVAVGELGGIEDLKRSNLETMRILYQSALFGQRRFFMRYGDLGVFALLAEVQDVDKLASLVPHKLRQLRENSGELIKTLRVYLDCNLNLKQAADKLFVHHKTVRYRVEKMKAIAGIDFQNPEELLQLGLGIRILDMLEQK